MAPMRSPGPPHSLLGKAFLICFRPPLGGPAEYGLPQTRHRLFIRGMRTSLVNAIPKALAPFGRRELRDALGDFPPTPLSGLTGPQRQNVIEHERLIKQKVESGIVRPTDLIVIGADRPLHGVFTSGQTVNMCPTLTSRNRYLYVIDAGEASRSTPFDERRFSRWITASERMAVQGFPPDVCAQLVSWGLCLKASGNAYPPPLIAAVLVPMLRAFAESGGALEARLPQALPAFVVPGMAHRVEQIFARPLPKQRARAQAKAKQKARAQRAVPRRRRASESS